MSSDRRLADTASFLSVIRCLNLLTLGGDLYIISSCFQIVLSTVTKGNIFGLRSIIPRHYMSSLQKRHVKWPLLSNKQTMTNFDISVFTLKKWNHKEEQTSRSFILIQNEKWTTSQARCLPMSRLTLCQFIKKSWSVSVNLPCLSICNVNHSVKCQESR